MTDKRQCKPTEKASDLMRDEFDLLYADVAIDLDGSWAGSHEPDAQKSSKKDNIFNHIPALTAPRRSVTDELTMYLSTDCDIPATSVDVEHIFSHGWLLLSHSKLGLVQDCDVKAIAVLADVDGEENDLLTGWDAINI
ncbi:hypothetical protein C8R48DRAFT_771585 [Suillus tomentosus]|nr:hypothetical protein C8R48DRAFT_771585 [Suillus tomentosus]